jgi:hypothetical protein
MVWILAENAVRLRFRQWKCSDNFADPPHVVPLIGIEGGEHLIRGKRHRSEELYAIDFSLRGEKHHPVIETIGTLLW